MLPLYICILSLLAPTLRTVCDELGGVTNKEYEIGIQLGISRNKLQDFRRESDILSAAIDYWLKGNVTDVPISWTYLVRALESDYVDEPGLARTICSKYCHQKESENEDGKKINVLTGAEQGQLQHMADCAGSVQASSQCELSIANSSKQLKWSLSQSRKDILIVIQQLACQSVQSVRKPMKPSLPPLLQQTNC